MLIDDETLMAYADGELAPAEAQRVRLAVEADPELQARLRPFTETRSLLQDAAGPAVAQARDADLIAAIRAASVPSAAPAPVLQQIPKPANFNLRPFVSAIAAAMALAVVGGIWWQSGGPDSQGLGAAQVAALNELPAGEMRETEDGGLTMIASYRLADGAFCREYETTTAEAARITVACRDGNTWAERFAVDMDTAQGYQAASGDIPGLDDFLSETGASQPLTAEEEASALTE